MAVKKSTKMKKPVVKAKKPVAKVKVVKKSPAPKAASKSLKISKPLTKSELYGIISESAEINRKQAAAIFDNLANLIELHLKKDGPEQFVLPGLLKIKVKKIPARPARKGKNPFTGEMMTFQAKPASKKVKIIPLRALKSMCS